jgi:hypothetical protein
MRQFQPRSVGPRHLKRHGNDDESIVKALVATGNWSDEQVRIGLRAAAKRLIERLTVDCIREEAIADLKAATQ